jgi:hypothetical protein
MKLRDHPLINSTFAQSWPPPWVSSLNGVNVTATGEVGVLKDVWMSKKSRLTIFLAISFENRRFVGCMTLSDPPFCSQLYRLLRGEVGRTIEEVGGLDLSFTL